MYLICPLPSPPPSWVMTSTQEPNPVKAQVACEEKFIYTVDIAVIAFSSYDISERVKIHLTLSMKTNRLDQLSPSKEMVYGGQGISFLSYPTLQRRGYFNNCTTFNDGLSACETEDEDIVDSLESMNYNSDAEIDNEAPIKTITFSMLYTVWK
ncbi:hypothetical protein TNCV_4214351 [Trichonephila clavipes]|nr:hypothetical protein TNCV_4214351 [Trichonephila clavipes]